MSKQTKQPKLPTAVLRHLNKKALDSKKQMVVVHWLDANFDRDGHIRSNNRFDCATDGCLDATIGYYHGIRDGCVILSNSAYIRDDAWESHRLIWSIPKSLVVRVDVLFKRGR